MAPNNPLANDFRDLLNHFPVLSRKVWHRALKGMQPQLTRQQIRLMKTLLHHGETQMGHLAEHMGIETPTLTSMVDRLLQMEFLVRNRSDQDRRVVTVALSKRGASLLEETDRRMAESAREIAEKLPNDEKETFSKIVPEMLSITRSLLDMVRNGEHSKTNHEQT